ncbi:hypothetical protein FQN55_004031 [Onygenales sp. PD_40]|nr:hypothetical protein FQN55_004031 [Onygenales sp. PD_40]KAK2794477.1 hypothetical protein FQN52_008055 [Onygenales sp. PD_12]KAK2800008.1 hypothetical protein FQN51_006437 [Onygenales sp. PD_10]
MAELTFTKSFLTALDSRPVKLPADYVFDPRSFPSPHPFTLPRLSDAHPSMPKKIKRTAIPGSSKSITVHLKSARNPVLNITLDNCAISTTTVQELKQAVQARVQTTNGENQPAKVPLDKIKVLWKKKPAQGQMLSEVLGNDASILSGGKEVELGLMILGGAQLAPEPTKEDQGHAAKETMAAESSVPIQGDGEESDQTALQNPPSRAKETLSTEEFWTDLEDFIRGKVHDSTDASRIKDVFRKAWESNQ